MDSKGREKPHGRAKCKGTSVRKSTGDESKTSRPETKNERRRREKEELLFENGRHEVETYFSENSQRPKLPN
jgi:hypothetical protein